MAINPTKPSAKKSKASIAAMEALENQQKMDKRIIKSYSPDMWKKIENWGLESNLLTQHQQNYCFTIAGRVRRNTEFEPLELTNGVKILELVKAQVPSLLESSEASTEEVKQYPKLTITLDVVIQAVKFDKEKKILKSISYTFLLELSNGKKQLTEQNKKIASWNIEILQKCGFHYKPKVA